MSSAPKPRPIPLPPADARLLGKALALWESDEQLARAAMHGLSAQAKAALVGAPPSHIIETGLATLPPLKRIAHRTALASAPKLRAEVVRMIHQAQGEIKADLTSQETAKPATKPVE